MFNRGLSDIRIDILTDRIVENFSGYSEDSDPRQARR